MSMLENIRIEKEKEKVIIWGKKLELKATIIKNKKNMHV